MRRANLAYTLIEILIVSAILAVLAALLMPVFVSVKSNAKKTVCIAHFKQAADATGLYVIDYEDRFMPISYRPGESASSRDDRTWVQLLLPYAPNFSIFLCPSDTSRTLNSDALFDQDLVAGDLYSEYYRASKHTNIGFNYMALSPVVRIGPHWESDPLQWSSVAHPSTTMLFLDSAWSETPEGEPVGGGNWLVEPPCRYAFTKAGTKEDLLAVGPKTFGDIFAESRGWSPKIGHPFGGAWPWHFGHVNVARADGSAISFTTSQLAAGCDVQDNWKGAVTSKSDSMWFSNP